ncbi:MAG: hypothetical protein Q8O76_12665, partial [Chloroflexota bacterium]|nr:hypothetical protein [Chloroflexota bacterium]
VFAAWANKVALYSEPVETKGIYKEKGQAWTVDELADLVPKTLAEGLVNPAPPRSPKEPGQPAKD